MLRFDINPKMHTILRKKDVRQLKMGYEGLDYLQTVRTF